VFVTSNSDFDARAKSTLVGGNDLMAKPFLIFEVAVKALTVGLHSRLQSPAAVAPKSESGRPTADSLAALPVVPRFATSRTVTRRPSSAATYTELNDSTRAFLNRLAVHLGPLRELSETLAEPAEAGTRQNLLADGFLRLNALSQNITDVVHPAYQLSRGLEGLLRKLLQDAAQSTPSAIATLATGVELLDELCVCSPPPDLALNPPIRLMVVDDDLVARRALVGALQTTFEKPESVESGEAALALARDDRFDVIFMDLQMPGMDGFQTCEKIHESGCSQDTPVVFITAHADFAARAEAGRAKGTDLVGKPFLTAEINVKALTFALRSRLQQARPEVAA
jgi:CheY-like chemotaxis protein